MSISWSFISTYVYISSYFKKLTAESWHYQILTSLFPKIFIQWGTQKIQLLKMNADQTNSMWIRLGALQKYEDIYIIGLTILLTSHPSLPFYVVFKCPKSIMSNF